jgi:hypothetical protein
MSDDADEKAIHPYSVMDFFRGACDEAGGYVFDQGVELPDRSHLVTIRRKDDDSPLRYTVDQAQLIRRHSDASGPEESSVMGRIDEKSAFDNLVAWLQAHLKGAGAP